MSQTTKQRLAENHVKNHIESVHNSEVYKVYQNLKNAQCECELIYLEASDFDKDIASGSSRNQSIKIKLNETYTIDEFSTFKIKSSKELKNGFWSKDQMSSIFIDILGEEYLKNTVYYIGETLDVILAARAKDLAPYIEELYSVTPLSDAFVMEENAKWLFQFSRHGKYAFASV